MKPILALLVSFFAVFLWQFASPPQRQKYALLYHTNEKTFGCAHYELTAHLLFLRTTEPVNFTKSLKESFKNQQCSFIFPSQKWYKKEHYYNITLLHPASWHRKENSPQDFAVPTSDLIYLESLPQGISLPSDFALLIALLIWLSYTIYAFYQKWRAWKFILEHLTYHREKLAQKRLQLVHYDTYGVTHYEKWYKEIDFFCNNYLLPNLRRKNLYPSWSKLEQRTKQLIHEWASLSATSQRVFTPPKIDKERKYPQKNLYFSKNMNPLDYEKLCAQLLEQAGWETYLTPASSDQGADIIAIRNNVRLVVQCKLYSRPVGNRAVQEIFTAKEHQKAQIAAVASNARYTRQAHQLAASTGVYLLHHKQLTRFTEKTPLIHPTPRN